MTAMTCLSHAHYSAFLHHSGRPNVPCTWNPHTNDKVNDNTESRHVMPSHWLPLSLWVPSKSVFNSLYAMVKSKSCVQSLSRFQSNLRVISGAFPSILSSPRIALAGRLTSAGRLFELVPLPAATLPLPRDFTSCRALAAAVLELLLRTDFASFMFGKCTSQPRPAFFFLLLFFFLMWCLRCVRMTQQTASAGDQTQSDAKARPTGGCAVRL